MPKVVLSVTTDLFSDQRVDKVCNSLKSMGFDVLLVGRCYNNSPKMPERGYKTKRIHLIFRKGPLFYAEFNLRLFFYLLFQKRDLFVANDLDTLLPNLLITKLKGKKLVYDAHEYFLGILEIQHRPKVKRVWQFIEQFCFPKLEKIITVSQSIAEQYKQEYGKEVKVVRNIPVLQQSEPIDIAKNRVALGLPLDKKIIILQGNAIHKDRGGEEIVEAIPYIDNAILIIVGKGDMLPNLKMRVHELNIADKVLFMGSVSPEQLRVYTAISDLGVTFDKNVSPNHYFSLPNKLFEYIHAGIPVVCSNLPERKRIVETYQVGVVLDDLSPKSVADAINQIFSNSEQLEKYKNNCKTATEELNWQKEEEVLKEIYEEYLITK